MCRAHAHTGMLAREMVRRRVVPFPVTSDVYPVISIVLCLCCPDKFRGSLTASEAAFELAAGARAAGWETVELPLADGGEGTLDVLVAARGGVWRTTVVSGPLGEPVRAEWAILPDGTAVIEMARASGLALIGAERNDPFRATTRGTGELISAAADEGATHVLVGVGGSATIDGGLGAVEALDWSLDGLTVTVACDVGTHFVDAAAVFGPQKGATEDDVRHLTARLDALAGVYRTRTGLDPRGLAGAGAAGGLAGGLAAIGATLRSGFDVVADAVQFERVVASADLVLTGEGKLDAASLQGKVVGGVLRRASSFVRCGLVVGEIDTDEPFDLPNGTVVESLTARTRSKEKAMTDAASLVRRAAFDIAQAACVCAEA